MCEPAFPPYGRFVVHVVAYRYVLLLPALQTFAVPHLLPMFPLCRARVPGLCLAIPMAVSCFVHLPSLSPSLLFLLPLRHPSSPSVWLVLFLFVDDLLGILCLFCRDPSLCADRGVCHSLLSCWDPSTVGPTVSGFPGRGFLHLCPTRGEERPQHTVDSKSHPQS